jgi:hypothetical protein
MYTPEISGSSCGHLMPPLTEWERKSACNFDDMLETMRCLYSRSFQPLYSEIKCPCDTCYEPKIWNKMIEQSSQLNKRVLWNDIIKRWEPVEFDQDLTENVDDVSGYEFRSYKDIYNINIDKYEIACDANTCQPTEDYQRGMGSIKMNYGYNVTEEKDNCCICNDLYSQFAANGNEYTIVHNITDYIDTIFPCGDHLWKLYAYSNIGTGNAVIKFMDILDPTQTFECAFQG